MSDYTPTTEEVLDGYVKQLTRWTSPQQAGKWQAEFDRWLNAVKAEAWDAAVEALDRHYGDLSGLDRIAQDLGDINPYRKTVTP